VLQLKDNKETTNALSHHLKLRPNIFESPLKWELIIKIISAINCALVILSKTHRDDTLHNSKRSYLDNFTRTFRTSVSHGDRKINIKVALVSKVVYVTLRDSFVKSDCEQAGFQKIPNEALQLTIEPSKISSHHVCTLTSRRGVSTLDFLREAEVIKMLMQKQEEEGASYIPKLHQEPSFYYRPCNRSVKVALNLTMCQGRDLCIYIEKSKYEINGSRVAYFRQLVTQPGIGELKLLIKMTKPVDFVHRQGCVHGDIKPENMLISADQNGDPIILLTDFGSFFSLDEGLLMDCLGSSQYSAPEVIRFINNGPSINTTRKLGTAIDCWSLGCSFYAVLTGQLPKISLFATCLHKVGFFVRTQFGDSHSDSQKAFRPSTTKEQLIDNYQAINKQMIKEFPAELFADIHMRDVFSLTPDVREQLDSFSKVSERIKILLGETSACYRSREYDPEIKKAITSLLSTLETRYEKILDLVQETPCPNNPLGALIWSLMRPKAEERVGCKLVLKLLNELVEDKLQNCLDPLEYSS
jgi:serine/threonine protein kinase